jgi:hypothetical protein
MYPRGMFSDKHPPEMRGFFIMSVKTLAEEIANWPEMKK